MRHSLGYWIRAVAAASLLTALVAVGPSSADAPRFDQVDPSRAAHRAEHGTATRGSWTPPARALLKLANYPWGASGYLDVHSGFCDACAFGNRSYPYDNYADVDTYWLRPWPDQRLAVITSRTDGSGPRLVLTVTNRSGQRVLRSTTALQRGWEPYNATVGPDGSLYLLQARQEYRDGQRAVVKISRYSSRLVLTGTAKLTARRWNIQEVVAGATAMLVDDDRLVVSFGAEAFVADAAGLHHQWQRNIVVDLPTMTPRSLDEAFTVSHSFNEFLARTADDLILVSHGDANPRALSIQRLGGYFSDTGLERNRMSVLPFPGTEGDNYTGSTLNGAVAAPSGALLTGVSLPQKVGLRGLTGNSQHWMPNVYLSSADPVTRHQTFTWVTKFDPRGKRWLAGQPRLVPVGNGRFALVYQVVDLSRSHNEAVPNPAVSTTHYKLVDGDGTVIASRNWRHTGFRPLSDLAAVGTRIFWVDAISNTNQTDPVGGHFLVGLDVTHPTDPRWLNHR